MGKLGRMAVKAGGFVVAAYLFVAFLMTPYYNWQYAKAHGFISWLLFGEIIATVRAVVWPYSVFLADRQSSERSPGGPGIEYTDAEYAYAFQYPSTWKIQPTPPRGEAGEVRVFVQSPTKRSHVMVTVGIIGNSLTREQFENSANRDTAVNAMIDLTVEQVYKGAAQTVGADSTTVRERRVLPSDVGVKFFISTTNTVTSKSGRRGVIGFAGTHIIPFGKDYMVNFVIVAPVDTKATEENAALMDLLNSFHVAGERPR